LWENNVASALPSALQECRIRGAENEKSPSVSGRAKSRKIINDRMSTTPKKNVETIIPESCYFLITCVNVPVDTTLSSMLLQVLARFGPDVRVILARKSEENDTIYIGITSSTNYTNSMVRDLVTSLFLGLESPTKLVVEVSRRKGFNSSCAELMEFPDRLLWGISPAELQIRGDSFKRKQRLVVAATQYFSSRSISEKRDSNP